MKRAIVVVLALAVWVALGFAVAGEKVDWTSKSAAAQAAAPAEDSAEAGHACGCCSDKRKGEEKKSDADARDPHSACEH